MRKRLGLTRPSPAMVVAMLALVMAFTGPAVADQVVAAAKKINGKNLKTRSIAGNRLRNNTITGIQVKESSLGKVPSASKADSATTATTASGISDGAVTTSKFGTIPSARVENTTAVNVPDAGTVTLSFNSEVFDTAGLHSTTTDTSRLTAPVSGTYQITGQGEWNSAANGYRFLIIRRGSDQARVGVSLIPVGAAAQYVYQQVTTLARLNAGDYVELRASQTSGGPLELFGGGGEESQNFMMHWAGPA
jgi:hypothetical protein